MTVHQMKKEFTKNELTDLIRKIDKSIERVEYVVREDGEEFVNVYDTAGRVTVRVCVTADSLSALTRDVLRAIG